MLNTHTHTPTPPPPPHTHTPTHPPTPTHTHTHPPTPTHPPTHTYPHPHTHTHTHTQPTAHTHITYIHVHRDSPHRSHIHSTPTHTHTAITHTAPPLHRAHTPFILHILIWRSSAADIMRGSEEWKDTQLTPRSWPYTARHVYNNIYNFACTATFTLTRVTTLTSNTCLTMTSDVPNSSVPEPGFRNVSTGPLLPGATVFFLSPDISHTRTVWSRLADATKSSVGWNWAHIT